MSESYFGSSRAKLSEGYLVSARGGKVKVIVFLPGEGKWKPLCFYQRGKRSYCVSFQGRQIEVHCVSTRGGKEKILFFLPEDANWKLLCFYQWKWKILCFSKMREIKNYCVSIRRGKMKVIVFLTGEGRQTALGLIPRARTKVNGAATK